MRPLILVTADHRPARTELPPGPRIRPSRAEVHVHERLIERLREAGAAVLILAPGDPASVELLPLASGLVLTGGAFDIHPRYYGQEIRTRMDKIDDARTEMELALCKSALNMGLPTLGICAGLQTMAVAAGGSLIQDIYTDRPDALVHEQPTSPDQPWHALHVVAGWEDLLGSAANSTHHQAIDQLGALKALAHAPDGIIEAVHLPEHPFALGVQWHPEWLEGGIFSALVAAAAAHQR